MSRRLCAAPGCREPLERCGTGRPRRYCSDACRQHAYRNRERQRKHRPAVHFSSQTVEWSTPQDVFDGLDAEFGFDLDPCATAENAKCERYFTRQEDGLAQTWTGRVFCNPPYGRTLGAWMRKAWEASQSTAELVVLLIPARTDTRWWHEYVEGREARFLPGRLRFGDAQASAPFPSVVVVFRADREAQKRRARGMVHRAVRDGVLSRQPCGVCGVERTEAHHEDYSKPLEVRWLCKRHHEEAHHGRFVTTGRDETPLERAA